MNLKDKRTRRIAVACASAVAATAGGVTAVGALANTGPLTITPGNSASITNVDVTASAANAAMAYGLRVTGTPNTTDHLFVKVDSAPSTGSQLWVEGTAGNTSPTAAAFVAATQTTAADTGVTSLSGDNVYLGADSPGTYNLRVFQDHNGNGVLDTGDDSTGTFTLTVKDITGVSPTSDDLSFSVSAPSSIDKGRPATASVDSLGITTDDIRGLNAGTGVSKLGEAIANNLQFTVAGASGGDDGTHAATFDGSKFTYTTAHPVVSAGPVSISAQLKTPALYPASVSPVQISVHDNTVATTALDVLNQKSNVKLAAGNATVRVGTTGVTYTVTAMNGAATPAPVEHATVWVLLDGLGGTLSDISQLSVSGQSITKLSATSGEFAVTTDNDGKATFTVNSTKTANNDTYTVTANTNGIGAPGAVTTTYQTPAVDSVSYGNYGLQVGTKANLTAKILDQWGQAFTPAGTSPQARLWVDGNGDGVYGGAAATGDYDTFVNIYDGGMSATVNDNSVTTSHTFGYEWEVGGTTYPEHYIKWLSSPAPGSAALDSLDGTALPLPAATVLAAPHAGVAPAGQAHTLMGTVKDGAGSVLPYASFTLTGSTGVYFWDVDNAAWVSSLSARTDVNGKIQAKGDQTGSSVQVLFTKSGSNTVTVNAGGKTDAQTFTVAKPDGNQAFTLNVNSQSMMPNTTVVVSGRVNDVFGNPVQDTGVVNVSADDATYGVFGQTWALDTNGSGDYSVSYAAGSKTGKVFLSAELAPGWTPPTVDPAWTKIDGLSLTALNKIATGNITIAPDAVSLSVNKTTLVGGGNVTVKGNTRHNAAVDVYFKGPGGGAQLIDSVTSDGNGDFSVPASVSQSGSFFAKTSTATSQSVAVKVVSTVKITGRSLGKGWIRVSVNGGPSKSGTVRLYQRLRGGRLHLLAKYSTTSGGASWKIKTGKGSFIFRATYTSNGAGTSAAASVGVKA